MRLVYTSHLGGTLQRCAKCGRITLPTQRSKFRHSAGNKTPAPLAPRPSAVKVGDKDAHHHRVRRKKSG
jgi:hypothetical protein